NPFPMARSGHVDDDIVTLHRDRDLLRDIGALHEGGAVLDRDREAAGADALGLAPGLAGADVEFPAMPGAAQELAAPRIAVVAGHRRFDQRGDRALAEAAALMRAAVEQPVEFTLEVEDDDRAALHGDQLAGARRDLAEDGDDMARHQASP